MHPAIGMTKIDTSGPTRSFIGNTPLHLRISSFSHDVKRDRKLDGACVENTSPDLRRTSESPVVMEIDSGG